MNEEMLGILNGDSGEEQLDRELNIAKFKSYAKEKFLDYVKYDIRYLDLIKESARHEAFNLPLFINEFFIRFDAAPYYWVLDSNILSKAEESFKASSKNVVTAGGNYAEIKKFYIKWLTQTNEKEKQYFALSTINLIERNINSNNFLKHLLNASIFTYDKKIYSPDKAKNLLEKTLQVIESVNLPEELQREFLYLVNVYYGFVELKKGNIETANMKFESAQQYKTNGITAVFYNAISEKFMGNLNRTQELLTKVIEFDKNAFNFAIENNSLPLFSHFFQNANIYNIFSEYGFSDMLPEIEMIISTQLSDDERVLYKLHKMILNLGELRMQRFYDDNIKKQLAFLEKYLNSFKENKNLLNNTAGALLLQKFQNVIELIANQVRNHHSERIEQKLILYDHSIEESKLAVEHLMKDIEQTKAKLKRSMNDTIEKINHHHKTAISALEYRIDHLEANRKYDPASAFSNSMIFNAVISLVVFVVGGLTGGFLETVNESYTMSEMFTQTVVAGIKWGGITFLLGLLIAMISSASAIWERSNVKLKLQRDITFLQSHKEKEIQHIKNETERKIKSFDKSYEHRLRELNKKIEILTEEKAEKLKELEDESKAEIDELTIKLTSTFQI